MCTLPNVIPCPRSFCPPWFESPPPPPPPGLHLLSPPLLAFSACVVRQRSMSGDLDGSRWRLPSHHRIHGPPYRSGSGCRVLGCLLSPRSCAPPLFSLITTVRPCLALACDGFLLHRQCRVWGASPPPALLLALVWRLEITLRSPIPFFFAASLHPLTPLVRSSARSSRPGQYHLPNSSSSRGNSLHSSSPIVPFLPKCFHQHRRVILHC